MCFFSELDAVVSDRLKNGPETSYTRTLVASGMDRVLQKIGEEAVEVVIAGKNTDKQAILNESADLIYHLAVMLATQGMSLLDVSDVLSTRHRAKGVN